MLVVSAASPWLLVASPLRVLRRPTPGVVPVFGQIASPLQGHGRPALLLVVRLAFVAGLAAVMTGLDRAHRRIVERRCEACKAEGSVGAHPEDFIGPGFNAY